MIRRRLLAIFLGAVAAMGLLTAAAGLASAVAAGRDEAGFANAKPCPDRAPQGGDCLLRIEGTVTGVTETKGKSPVDQLRVNTAIGPFRVSFTGSNALLDTAAVGQPVTLTSWRGRIETVTGGGIAQGTAEVPATRFRTGAGGAATVLGVSLFMLAATWVAWKQAKQAGTGKRFRVVRPLHGFLLVTTPLSGFVLIVAGIAYGAGADGPAVSAVAATALAALFGLAGWAAVRASRRATAQSTLKPWERLP